jgi:hypothetical protein
MNIEMYKEKYIKKFDRNEVSFYISIVYIKTIKKIID